MMYVTLDFRMGTRKFTGTFVDKIPTLCNCQRDQAHLWIG